MGNGRHCAVEQAAAERARGPPGTLSPRSSPSRSLPPSSPSLPSPLPSPSGRGHAARLHRPPELPRPGEGHPALLQRLWPPARGRPQKRVSAALRAGSRPADASGLGPRLAFPSRAGRAAPGSPPPLRPCCVVGSRGPAALPRGA